MLAPLVACIVALALWPGLILERGEGAVDDKIGAVAVADCGADATYFSRSAGAPASAGVVAEAGCAQEYGLNEEEILASAVCGGGQVSPGAAGYVMRFCHGAGWTGYAPLAPGGEQ